MPRSNAPDVETSSGHVELYSTTARTFHWLTVALIAMQVPIGFYMVYRGNTLNLWDATTNNLYSSHKAIGLVILAVVAARLLYRLSAGAPKAEPTIEPWQHAASELNHWGMYALLIAMPIGGYLGIAYFPALNVFGVDLPAIVAPDKEMAKLVFAAHALGAWLLVVLVSVHIAAALYHYAIRGDNVLGRMIPALIRRRR